MKPDPQTITFDARVKRQSEIHEAALASCEFDCIDCGVHVPTFGRVPGGQRCTGCQWVAATPDPTRRQTLRAQLIAHAVIGAPLP